MSARVTVRQTPGGMFSIEVISSAGTSAMLIPQDALSALAAAIPKAQASAAVQGHLALHASLKLDD